MTRPDDLALLRRYEPSLRFTRGELFFPVSVEPYVRRCSLWSRPRGAEPRCLVPTGELDLDRLAGDGPIAPGEVRFLQFVQEPLTSRAYREWSAHLRREFHAPGRLARVGLVARFADGLFSLSLLLRGTVPGGTTAMAAAKYREMMDEAPGYVYYARVTRDPHYTVLQYLYFYAMNDWRSSFFGVNDHEADWEQVLVYLEERADGEVRPAWVACAAHNESGDDLRRRWDDPTLRLEGEHPVVFIAAGSHAAYFEPGEYVVEVDLRVVRRLTHVLRVLRYLWRDLLRQGDRSGWTERLESFFRVPFVDYARGDGLTIGPGGEHRWQAVSIDEDVGWVRHYRGLWGLDVQDIFAGELAPAGPRYARDGTVRDSWRDPVGWTGLRKVPPEASAGRMLEGQIETLEAECVHLEQRIAALDQELQRGALEVRALERSGYLAPVREQRANEVASLERERDGLDRRRTDLRETLDALRQLQQAPAEERRGDPREHIHRVPRPETPAERRRHVLVEVWAALSVSILLLGGVGLLLLGVDNLVVALGMLIAAVVVAESLFHRRITGLLVNAVLALAVVTALVLIYEFAWQIALGVVAALAAVILVDNVRELRRR